MDFEKAMKELESLVENMENGELSLEDSLKSFEQGVKLTRLCQQSLKKAEQKVAILLKKDKNSALSEFDND
jgi:exodeoxyribonuclease VII small subunit